jgi:hypothetical protein
VRVEQGLAVFGPGLAEERVVRAIGSSSRAQVYAFGAIC